MIPVIIWSTDTRRLYDDIPTLGLPMWRIHAKPFEAAELLATIEELLAPRDTRAT
ncbi:MAG: hypothetical protein M3R24_29215 [Chloroflexota bacterium]|nr:hypothetical protein [Chloroflexota bacterium]